MILGTFHSWTEMWRKCHGVFSVIKKDWALFDFKSSVCVLILSKRFLLCLNHHCYPLVPWSVKHGRLSLNLDKSFPSPLVLMPLTKVSFDGCQKCQKYFWAFWTWGLFRKWLVSYSLSASLKVGWRKPGNDVDELCSMAMLIHPPTHVVKCDDARCILTFTWYFLLASETLISLVWLLISGRLCSSIHIYIPSTYE